jgi:hypothetical protein
MLGIEPKSIDPMQVDMSGSHPAFSLQKPLSKIGSLAVLHIATRRLFLSLSLAINSPASRYSAWRHVKHCGCAHGLSCPSLA